MKRILFYFWAIIASNNLYASNCDTLKNTIAFENAPILEVHIDLLNGVFLKTVNPNVFGIWSWTGFGNPYKGRNIAKFDLSNIPQTVTINSADFYLYADSTSPLGLVGSPTFGTANSCTAKRITTIWDTTTLSWINYGTTTVGMSPLAQSINTVQDYIIDLSQMVQYWVANPAQNYGVEFKHDNEGTTYNSLIFHSSTSVVLNKRPKLIICYSFPNATTNISSQINSFACIKSDVNHLQFKIPALSNRIELFDLQGKKIYSSILKNNELSQTVSIDELHLPQGIYVAAILSKNKKEIIKIMVQ